MWLGHVRETYHRSGKAESSSLKRLWVGGDGELVSIAAAAAAMHVAGPAGVADRLRLRGAVLLWCCICSSRNPWQSSVALAPAVRRPTDTFDIAPLRPTSPPPPASPLHRLLCQMTYNYHHNLQRHRQCSHRLHIFNIKAKHQLQCVSKQAPVSISWITQTSTDFNNVRHATSLRISQGSMVTLLRHVAKIISICSMFPQEVASQILLKSVVSQSS